MIQHFKIIFKVHLCIIQVMERLPQNLLFLSQETWSERPKAFLALDQLTSVAFSSTQCEHSTGERKQIPGWHWSSSLPTEGIRPGLESSSRQWVSRRHMSGGQSAPFKDRTLCSAALGCLHFGGQGSLPQPCGRNPKCSQRTHQAGQSLGPFCLAPLLDKLERCSFCSSA